MADSKDSPPRSDSGTLDAKSLLYGAVSLIVLLTGALYGLYSTDNARSIEENRQINMVQWERLRALNDTLIQQTANIADIRKDIDDQEVRLRTLEHRGDAR